MTLHSLLTATSAVVHPHSVVAATPLATTVAVAAGVVVMGVRQRLHGSRRAGGAVADRGVAVPSGVARPATPALPPGVRRTGALTCRPQLLPPPGTERARGQVELWRQRGELDPETYLDLQRVIAEVDSASR